MTHGVLALIRNDLLRLRDDDKLHEYVEDELHRLHGSRYNAHKQLQRRIAELDQTIAKVRDHLIALGPETADSLGLYEKAPDLAKERVLVEAQLDAKKDETSLPPVGDLRKRIARAFDRLEEVMASGLVEDRRQLVACYVHPITADPATPTGSRSGSSRQC